jgi:hypothetical protein
MLDSIATLRQFCSERGLAHPHGLLELEIQVASSAVNRQRQTVIEEFFTSST